MIEVPMTQALASALFHFLWQGAVLALVPALALMFRSPRVRYAAACVALFAMPVVFAVTLAVTIPAAGSRAVIPIGLPQAVLLAPPSAVDAQPFDFERSMRWFVPFWIAGVALFYLRTFAGWIVLLRLRRASSTAAPAFWKERADALAARLGIGRAIALFRSDLVDVPVVAGFLRPAIFVPAALFTGMPVEQLEYLLIHELAHIRRFDYAVNLLQKAVEGLLFYHPAVWWVSRMLRTERENCCDDAVLAVGGDAREYASVLASLERTRCAPALGASGGNLGKRVLRLLNPPSQSSLAPVLGLLAIAISATVAWAALQQAQPLPQLPAPPQPPAPPAIRLVAQARPEAAPLPTPFKKWLDEDVAYIISSEERAAFQNLTTDAERERFIEQFWQRRDPSPGTVVNEFKEEYYRRIGYANQRFRAAIPGWKTDRGRIYIMYGPPDEIDSHPSGGSYQRPASEGGGVALMYPFEDWRYRYIEGVGANVAIRFIDPALDGSYRMASDPSNPNLASPRPPVVAEPMAGGITVSVSLDPTKNISVFVGVTTTDGRPITTALTPAQHQALYQLAVPLLPGSYRLNVIAKDADSATAAPANYELSVTVP
jgi:GWxTD domain-containing protein